MYTGMSQDSTLLHSSWYYNAHIIWAQTSCAKRNTQMMSREVPRDRRVALFRLSTGTTWTSQSILRDLHRLRQSTMMPSTLLSPLTLSLILWCWTHLQRLCSVGSPRRGKGARTSMEEDDLVRIRRTFCLFVIVSSSTPLTSLLENKHHKLWRVSAFSSICKRKRLVVSSSVDIYYEESRLVIRQTIHTIPDSLDLFFLSLIVLALVTTSTEHRWTLPSSWSSTGSTRCQTDAHIFTYIWIHRISNSAHVLSLVPHVAQLKAVLAQEYHNLGCVLWFVNADQTRHYRGKLCYFGRNQSIVWQSYTCRWLESRIIRFSGQLCHIRNSDVAAEGGSEAQRWYTRCLNQRRI